MAFYLDMDSLIQMFGVPLTVLDDDKESGEWVDGVWKEAPTKSIELNEPFLTFEISGSILAGLLESNNQGDDMSDKAAWFSEHDYSVGTKVIHNGTTWKVTRKQSYLDYSNVVQYELTREGGLDGTDF
ncbi:hypothetical protein G7084_01500 [Weissella coleopterorum]|uniref:Uncharacterized protein n=1 Tax=Weissella coleopterorum TaxID=2714949 RepID=A0A6G8AYD3_9LACO|nr:hypothetical protein [Weissella coleopterorum]QIL50111.1 hypothetical protein G7084_01500 [Weissella coleopterorum]